MDRITGTTDPRRAACNAGGGRRGRLPADARPRRNRDGRAGGGEARAVREAAGAYCRRRARRSRPPPRGRRILHARNVHAVLGRMGVAEAGSRRRTLRQGASRRLPPARHDPAGWFSNGKLSGGGIVDLHVHDTDFVYHLFGKPDGVFSQGHRGPSGEIDHVLTQYIYDDGPPVSAEGSWAMDEGYGFSMRYTVNFEHATADYDSKRKPRLQVFAGGKWRSRSFRPDTGIPAR